MLSMVMALTALGIDVMLPAFGEMRAAFGLAADSNEVAGIVTAYVFGLAGGTLLFGPLSDWFGRKPAIYIGLAVYGLASIGAALAPSLELLIASRVVWGVGAAGPRIVSVSIIRDLYQGEQMAKVMSFIFALFILVPILAPSLGALIIAVAPWRWLFWATAIWAGLLGLWLVRLGETMDPANRIELSAHDLWRATRFVLGNRQTLGYAVALTIGFGAFVSYLATSQLIFSDIFDKADLFPFIFGGLAAGMGVAMLANAFLVERYGVRRLIRLTLVVFITASAGLLGLALGSGGPPPLWAFLAGLAVVLAMPGLLIPNMNSVAMDPMGEVAGTAAAIVGAMSAAGGAVLGALIDRAYDGTIMPLALGFMASSVVALVVVVRTDRAYGT